MSHPVTASAYELGPQAPQPYTTVELGDLPPKDLGDWSDFQGIIADLDAATVTPVGPEGRRAAMTRTVLSVVQGTTPPAGFAWGVYVSQHEPSGQSWAVNSERWHAYPLLLDQNDGHKPYIMVGVCDVAPCSGRWHIPHAWIAR